MSILWTNLLVCTVIPIKCKEKDQLSLAEQTETADINIKEAWYSMINSKHTQKHGGSGDDDTKWKSEKNNSYQTS